MTPTPPFVSSPNAAGRRFLVTLLEHAFADGWRTPDDFLRHFPASVLLSSLKNATDLRVALLGAATGLHEEILRRKKPSLAAEDLHFALQEGMTNSNAILEVFSAEDRVRYLDPHELWSFLVGDEFWQQEATASAELVESCASRMFFTISAAISERLLTPRDVLNALTFEGLASFLSPRDLRLIVSQALAKGCEGIALGEKVLFEIIPMSRLCRVVPLEILWSEVVLRQVAVPVGLTTLDREERRSAAPTPRSVLPQSVLPQSVLPQAVAPPPAQRAVLAPSAPPVAKGPSVPPPIPPHLLAYGGPSNWSEDDQADQAPTTVPPSVAPRDAFPRELATGQVQAVGNTLRPPNLPAELMAPAATLMPLVAQNPLAFLPEAHPVSSRPPAPAEMEERKRARVTEHLSAIARLPPNYDTLPTQVLRSIDAMYALLPSAADDIQRKSVIRQSFANENYLRAALLGLIALMDSSIDTSDPVIQEAKIEALIKILLFEEQRRKEAGGSNGTGPVPALPVGAAQSAWPPVVAAPALVTQGLQAPPSFVPPSLVPSSFAAVGYSQPPLVAPQAAIPRPNSLQPNSLPPGGIPMAPATGAPVQAPLPNLPAEPSRSGGRSVPPPLPPGYQGNRN